MMLDLFFIFIFSFRHKIVLKKENKGQGLKRTKHPKARKAKRNYTMTKARMDTRKIEH